MDKNEMRKKVMQTRGKVYCTKVYQYWINSNGHLCRARRENLDTTEMYKQGAIEILD